MTSVDLMECPVNQKRPRVSNCTSERPCKKRMVRQSSTSARLQFNPTASDAPKPSDKMIASPVKTIQTTPATTKTPCPFTDEFFRDVAHTIANTFPFEAFARAQSCSLKDVSHALSAVVLAPLRQPHPLLDDNLSVSEYGQVLIAEWRARDQSRPEKTTPRPQNQANTPAVKQSLPSKRRCCYEDKPPVARTPVQVDIWGDYIPADK